MYRYFSDAKEKSFKNALNNIGPTTELCGTPEIMSLKFLQMLLTNVVDV